MKRNPATRPRRTGVPVDPDAVFARDLMQTDLLTLRADDSIRAAAEQLEEIHASAAPVVDAADRLLGVLSLSDIAGSEHVDADGVATRLEAEPEEDLAPEVEGVDEELVATETWRDTVVGRARVADWMSPGVITVPPDASLATICRLLLDEDIHRVFVIDHERLRGVVSTKDVVRLLAAPGAARAPRR